MVAIYCRLDCAPPFLAKLLMCDLEITKKIQGLNDSRGDHMVSAIS